MAILTSKIWCNEGEISKFFIQKVVRNPDMHRKVKHVPKEIISTKGKFAAYIYDRQGHLVFKMVESVNVEDYIDFIMNYR